MNEKLENNKDKPAYIKYDRMFGNILMVALHDKLIANESEAILAVSRETVFEFLNGKKKIYDYLVSCNPEGYQVLIIREDQLDARSFWELIDITSLNGPMILVDMTYKHFTIKHQNCVITENSVLYITEKNDPNCLHYTIRLKEYVLNKDRTWTIPINLNDEYSIYVSVNVTRNK